LKNSLNNTEAARFGVDSHHDAVYLVPDLVKGAQDFTSRYDLDFAKSYEQAETEVVVELSSGAERNKYHLVFFSVPYVGLRHLEEPGAVSASAHRESSGSNGNNDFVFLGVTNLVQGPEKVIPSGVRLEPTKQRLDVAGNVFTPTAELGGHSVDASSEREGGGFGVAFARGKCYRVTRSIESTAKIAHDFCSDVGNIGWHGLSEPDLANLMARLIRVRLYDLFAWVELVEIVNFPLKVGKAFISPSEFAFRVCKGVGH